MQAVWEATSSLYCESHDLEGDITQEGMLEPSAKLSGR